MFLSREIDKKKLCQVYTKIHMFAILNKSCSIKQIIFSKYKTNLKTTISYRSLSISGLLLLYFLFAIWIDILIILLNIVRIVRITSPGTSANGSAVYWSHDFRSCISDCNDIAYVLYLSLTSEIIRFHPTPFHFSITVPLTFILDF